MIYGFHKIFRSPYLPNVFETRKKINYLAKRENLGNNFT